MPPGFQSQETSMRKILMIAALLALFCPALAGTFYGGERGTYHGPGAQSFGLNEGTYEANFATYGANLAPYGANVVPYVDKWGCSSFDEGRRAPPAVQQDGFLAQGGQAAVNDAGLCGDGSVLSQSIRQSGYWEDQRAGNYALVFGSGNMIEQSIYQETYGGSQWAFNQAEVHGGPNYIDQRIEQRSQGMAISVHQSGILSDGTMTQSAYTSSNGASVMSSVTI